jgi:hypothetical protein
MSNETPNNGQYNPQLQFAPAGLVGRMNGKVSFRHSSKGGLCYHSKTKTVIASLTLEYASRLSRRYEPWDADQELEPSDGKRYAQHEPNGYGPK